MIFGWTASLLCIFDIQMLREQCSCTKPDFLGKIPFGQKQNMIKNEPEIGFYFETFCNSFLLERFSNNNCSFYLSYCKNSISGKLFALELLLERLSTNYILNS